MTTKPFAIEDVIAAYKNASVEARDVFNDEKTTDILVALDDELRLDDDQAFILGREVGYVLIGLTDQNDFTDRLKAAGFSPDMVNAILFEVMKKIFLPLSKQLNGQLKKNPALANVVPQKTEGEKESGEVSTPLTPPLKPNPVTISVPRYMSAPPLQSPLYIRNESKVPQIDGAVLPQKMTTPRAAVTLGVNDIEPLVKITRTPSVPPQPQAPKAPVGGAQSPAQPRPTPRTPLPTIPTIAPVAELPLGEGAPVVRPAPVVPIKPVQMPAVQPSAPAKPIQVPPMPAVPAQPPVAAQTRPNPPAPPVAPTLPPAAPAAPKAPVPQQAAVAKAQTADPYREPIDQKDL